MKAIQYRSYGDYSENRLVDLPQPALRDGEVLVAMRTVGINPLDNTFRSGHFYGATPENLPCIGGQTGAGAVVASKSDAFNVGNRVFVRGPGFGIMTDGTWREFVAAPAASPAVQLQATLDLVRRFAFVVAMQNQAKNFLEVFFLKNFGSFFGERA